MEHSEPISPEPLKNQIKNSSIMDQTEAFADKILCIHCMRTASNRVSCKGICVADSEY